MPNQDVILFDCPRCLHNLRVAKDQSGNRIVCPKCNVPLTVPGQLVNAGLFDDIFDSPAAPVSSKSKPEIKATSKTQPAEQLAKRKPELGDDNPLTELLDEETPGNNLVKDRPSPHKDDSNPLAAPDLLVDPSSDPLAGLSVLDSAKTTQSAPATGKDPFKVDPDAPLKVDGVGDIFPTPMCLGPRATSVTRESM